MGSVLFSAIETDLCGFIMEYIICIYFIYESYIMGIVKISDPLHEELRKSSHVMSRSINSQAEFWIKIGMLAEFNPELTFNQIIRLELRKKKVSLKAIINE